MQPNPKMPPAQLPSNQLPNPYLPPQEIHLRRLRVVEALERLKLYLEDAHVANLPKVRVIHGKGTGVLRNAIWAYLSVHSLVKSYNMATPNEGNGGVTIVDLME